MDTVTTHSMTSDSLQAQQAIFVAIASFTVLCWDHIITFEDEVALIWCKPKHDLLWYLFLLNRYITPLGFIVNIIALTRPTWTSEYSATDHAGFKPATAIPGLLFLVWFALEVYAMARGGMVSISQQVHSCHGVHDLPLAIIAARAWMPLTYDSSVFAMTLWRTLWNKEAAPIKLKMLCNGTLYYTVICPANLALTVMIVRAPPGQKGVAAQ
ncbi:hypothetical protein BDR07DRAFT_1484394 [Suillus spraguei]|nr:hypothetical protein BDR07DRAFT_1484394 [Suillus spraguei]